MSKDWKIKNRIDWINSEIEGLKIEIKDLEKQIDLLDQSNSDYVKKFLTKKLQITSKELKIGKLQEEKEDLENENGNF